MPRDSLQQFDPTPALDTDISGISTAPGWSPANVGPAFRALMSQLSNYAIPVSITVSGSATATAQQATGTLIATAGTGGTLTIPARRSWGWLWNTCTGPVVIATGTGAGVTVQPGLTSLWFCSDAVNVYAPVLAMAVGPQSSLTVAGGITAAAMSTITLHASAITINGVPVVYANGGTWGISITGAAVYANSAGFATNATNAANATNATNASIADYATNAGFATNATNAANASIAANATTADFANVAGFATDASTSTYAVSAGSAALASGAVGGTFDFGNGWSAISSTTQQLNFATGQFIEFVPASGFTYVTSGQHIFYGVIHGTGNASSAGLSYSYDAVGPSVGGGPVGYGGIFDTWVVAAGFGAVSDGRVKTNVEDITIAEATAWVRSARPRKYLKDGKVEYGFVAQEDLNTPRAISVWSMPSDDPRFLLDDTGVVPRGHRLNKDYNMEAAPLVAVVQSLLAKVDRLEAQIAELRGAG